ncbi:tyrosine-type recombinase/integrase, partial [Burkholderia ubonensis]|uniref:tyrosine-type recombinase/integrase n=1 Tax=Burkholderia ubonensis TaxID=101571 RepID=UPI000AE94E57
RGAVRQKTGENYFDESGEYLSDADSGHLDQLLAAPAKVQKPKHHTALPYTEIGAFVAELRAMVGTAARALEFTILTAMRTGEVIGAYPDELDMRTQTWTVPADRMKAKRPHRVPLSSSAIALIKTLPQISGGPLFEGARERRPLSNMAMLKVLERMGHETLTVHGFRSTFRDWAAECTPFPNEVVEMALAHTIRDKTESAYRRGDLFEKRRLLMQAWADYIEQQTRTVDNLAAQAA